MTARAGTTIRSVRTRALCAVSFSIFITARTSSLLYSASFDENVTGGAHDETSNGSRLRHQGRLMARREFSSAAEIDGKGEGQNLSPHDDLNGDGEVESPRSSHLRETKAAAAATNDSVAFGNQQMAKTATIVSGKPYPTITKFLIIYPTIPTPFKGSDCRPLQAVQFLSQAGLEVDLLFWRDYASEVSDDDYNDHPDRKRLEEAGVTRILGPYDRMDFTDRGKLLSWYDAVLFWLWPSIELLDMLADVVTFVKALNGSTTIIAAIDDAGLAARMLQGGLMAHKIPMNYVEDFVLSQRPREFLGPQESVSTDREASNTLVSDLNLHPLAYAKVMIHQAMFLYNMIDDPSVSDNAKVMIHQEMLLYSMADVLIGINAPTVRYLKKIVTGKPTYRLTYRSPVLPSIEKTPEFEDRQDCIFFGNDNVANVHGLDWFIREVLPLVRVDFKLHIVGTIPTHICRCGQNQKPPCKSSRLGIVCHGSLSDTELNDLIKSSRVAITPTFESTGVSTKTIRAMAFSTPAVVTDRDGTFDEERTSAGGKRCMIGPTDFMCFAEHLTVLLTNAQEWNVASVAAPIFVAENFGAAEYESDWSPIIGAITDRRYKIIIQGDAIAHGGSLPSQNWHIANMLHKVPEFQAFVLSERFEPRIPGIRHVTPTKKFATPFQTGFQADVVIQQSWPPNLDILPASYCGSGCRIVKILPWEFASLPESWVPLLHRNVDFLWAPSEYSRQSLHTSGWSRLRSAVMPAGIDCDELSAAGGMESKTSADPVTFVFSGGLIPRKGVDTILEEWENVMCSDSLAKLILHTSYEYGYSDAEITNMNRIVTKCRNIDWRRDQWMDRESYLAMLSSSDIYLAPYRSECFGIAIVEASYLGLSIVTSGGETASRDYTARVSAPIASAPGPFYPVDGRVEPCRHYPCRGKEVCGIKDECEKLVNSPSWFEVDRSDLRAQIKKAYLDIQSTRSGNFRTSVKSEEAINSHFCWSQLEETYHQCIIDIVKSPMQRARPVLDRPILQNTDSVS